MKKCTFDEHRNGVLCGRPLLGDVACPIHDHVKCACGLRLTGGKEKRCPRCSRDVRLEAVLKGGPA